MVKVGPLVVAAICCLAAVEALLAPRSQGSTNTTNSQVLEEVQNKCTPGKFYKRGCKRCFCDDNQRPVCGRTGDCKLANKYPTKPNFLHSYSSSELQKLPSLPHQSSNCTPGVTYRVDCDACICLANKNLMCNDLLCPSYEDINRILAKEMTGKNADFIYRESLAFLAPTQSSSSTYHIRPQTACPESLIKSTVTHAFASQLANKNLMCNDLLCPSIEDINRILAKEMTGNKCAVGRNKTGECISCSCIKGILKCEAQSNCVPNGRRDYQYESPLDLDVKENRQCSKGMVYKRDCNRCYCQKDNTLRCTLMRCLKHTEVQRLKKLRTQLEREGL